MTVKRKGLFLIGLIVAALALVASGCGGDSGGEAPEALPSSSCTAIEYEGEGNADYIIASDLPLQGSSRAQSLQINQAIRYELGEREWKAGDFNIGFQACDDATAQAAKWDSGKCSQNGNAYAANDKVIGVIGTFNSGCAAIIIPVLNEATGGAIPMVSPANTWPCLTVNLPGGCAAGARQVLSVGGAQLPARCPERRLSGRRGGRVRTEPRHQERVRPERRGGLRSRRRDDIPQGRGIRRDRRSPASRLGTRRRPATRPSSRRSRGRGPTQSSSAVSPTRTAAR